MAIKEKKRKKKKKEIYLTEDLVDVKKRERLNENKILK